MVLRMKNFNIFKVHWKIRLLGGGGSQKTIYRGDCVKRGCLGHFVDLMGGLGKKEGGGVFEGGGWYPNAHYVPLGKCIVKYTIHSFYSEFKD